VPRISYQNARVDHAIVGGSVCEVRLGSSLKSANQLVENVVDGWSVTAENLIGRGDRLQLRQCSGKLGFADRAVPPENRPHCPELEMECQRLRGEGAHRANKISQNLSLTCIQRHKSPPTRWRCNGHGRRCVAKERGRPNTAHAVGTCTVLWRPRCPAPILQLPDGAFAARMPVSRPSTPPGPVANLVPRFRGAQDQPQDLRDAARCSPSSSSRPAGALDDARVARAASAEARLALGGVRLGQPMGPWRFPESCHPRAESRAGSGAIDSSARSPPEARYAGLQSSHGIRSFADSRWNGR